VNRPTNATVAGRAFLAVRRAAKADGRTTAEYLRLYALEGFLLRLSQSEYRDRFVLKGGVLLAAYAFRRPTTDIDVAALNASNDPAAVRRFLVEIAATRLPPDLDDGLVFDLDRVTADVIRDEDQYAGVRVRMLAQLASARETFHIDVNFGDPIWPEPALIALPRLVDASPITLRGYPVPMVLAEKLVTALQRGTASTRWRDFGDVYLLTGRYEFDATVVADAIRAVAEHRGVPLTSLGETLDGYTDIGQNGWAGWRARLQLADLLPRMFAEVLAVVIAFADPVLTGTANGLTWRSQTREWAR
jgi:predicted nucleotidyltransferase component of viral defense system